MSNAVNEDGGELSRRLVLKGATIAVGAMAGIAPAVSPALADTPAQAGFGAPLVELSVPAGVLNPEQKAAMIKGITDVVLANIRVPADQTKKLWVQIFETADSGWGVGGQVFVPRK